MLPRFLWRIECNNHTSSAVNKYRFLYIWFRSYVPVYLYPSPRLIMHGSQPLSPSQSLSPLQESARR